MKQDTTLSINDSFTTPCYDTAQLLYWFSFPAQLFNPIHYS